MPSTVVHVAFAALVAAGLLGPAFDRRALVVVCAVAAFPDLDSIVGLLVAGTHRAAFHTLLIPLGGAAVVYWDVRIRRESWLRERYGDWGVRVAWVSLAGYVVAAIGLDLFHSLGTNIFYPLHDQFYRITGDLQYSTTGGWTQSFVDVQGPDGSGQPDIDSVQRGSTEEVHVPTGVDTEPGPDPADVERHFPVAVAGWQLFLVLTSVIVVTVKLRLSEGPGEIRS